MTDGQGGISTASCHDGRTFTESCHALFCIECEDDGPVRRLPVSEDQLSLGSAADNDLVLSHREVSRHHAVLQRVGGEVAIRDLGSRNGTYVDGERVHATRRAPPFSLRLGSTATLQVLDEATNDVHVSSLVPAVGTGPRPAARDEETESPGDAATIAVRHFLRSLGAALGARPVLAAVTVAAREVLDGRWAVCVRRNARSTTTVGEILESSGELPGERALAAALERGEGEGLHVSPSGTDCRLVVEVRRSNVAVTDLVDDFLSQLSLTPAPSGESSCPRLDLAALGYVDSGSELMRRLHERMSGALTSRLPILLRGPTGTGKEVYARALHAYSEGTDGPFQPVNASAVPEPLIEAIVFGTNPGVATGVQEQLGLARAADGGTLFFDEIGDMSPAMQVKLLRLLDDREVLPVGATNTVRVDVRFIAATNRDLDAGVEAGWFRSDLLHRIRGHEFVIPALADRPADVPTLVHAFLDEECRESGRSITGLSMAAIRALQNHDWPGNVRELRSVVRRMVHEVPSGSTIHLKHLSPSLRKAAAASNDLEAQLDVVRRRAILRALEEAEGNRSVAAKHLGLSRGGLRQLMRRLELE